MYDTVIISEKPIAGESIAHILSNAKMKQNKNKNLISFEFDHEKFGKTILIPLKGHITNVDFKKEYASWQINLRKLLNDNTIFYKNTLPGIVKSLGSVKAKKLIIATDADREGESIGREAVNVVKKKNPKIKIERAYFSAITKEELNKAFFNTEALNEKAADAADSRREIDLYWGAVLTRFMSTITGFVGKSFLSVGRVQSPTLAEIVKKELDIANFVSTPYWEIELTLKKDDKKEKAKFKALYKKGRILKKEEADKIFAKIQTSAKVINVTKKEKIVKKPVPLNTTDFLRACSNINIDTIKAISIAENLYMKGYISYPRTDNQKYVGVNYEKILKDLNQGEFKEKVQMVLDQKEIIPSKGVTTKDHPPIHPVTFVPKEKLQPEEWKVYKFIVDHFLATLYKDARTNITNVELDANSEVFVSKGLSFIDKGWLKIYPYYAQKEAILPELNIGEMCIIINKDLLAKKTKPPARYSQGTLIKLMEKLNLGTKSTRPNILKKLYLRQYISGKKQIVPSEIAKTLVKTLQDYAGHVVSPKMTAKLEKEMNEIENGKLMKKNVVEDSKNMLLEILDELYKNKKEISTNFKETQRLKNLVGKCPICGSDLVKRKSKKGKIFVGCSAYPKCTQSYPLPQKGEIIFTKKTCEECKAPIIQMKSKKSKTVSEFCINPFCKTNKEYTKKLAEAKAEKKDPQKQKI